MDMMDDIAADLSPLEQRRAALRALSDEIMETIKTLPKPQSWLEGDRAMRCLVTADRGETPAPVKRPANPVTGRDTPCHKLAQHFSRGRDLIMELNAAPP